MNGRLISLIGGLASELVAEVHAPSGFKDTWEEGEELAAYGSSDWSWAMQPSSCFEAIVKIFRNLITSPHFPMR